MITAKSFQSIKESILGPSGKDEEVKASNKELYDFNTAQQLSADQILALQKGGIVGKELIGELVGNSSTFEKKTVYSQEKYIKKKEKKYIKKIFVYSPTVQMICQYYMNQAPSKINCIRFDMLALILHVGDVQPGAIVTVNENASGLVLAAIAERMGGEGSIHYVYTDNKMELEILSKLNISSVQKKNIMYTNMQKLLENNEAAAKKKEEKKEGEKMKDEDDKSSCQLFDIMLKEQERKSTR